MCCEMQNFSQENRLLFMCRSVSVYRTWKLITDYTY
jgi:hypothetical protein